MRADIYNSPVDFTRIDAAIVLCIQLSQMQSQHDLAGGRRTTPLPPPRHHVRQSFLTPHTLGTPGEPSKSITKTHVSQGYPTPCTASGTRPSLTGSHTIKTRAKSYLETLSIRRYNCRRYVLATSTQNNIWRFGRSCKLVKDSCVGVPLNFRRDDVYHCARMDVAVVCCW